MPKRLTAINVEVEGLSIQTDAQGTVDGLIANVKVSYGQEKLREEFDLWGELNSTHRTAVISMYDRLNQLLQAEYLGN